MGIMATRPHLITQIPFQLASLWHIIFIGVAEMHLKILAQSVSIPFPKLKTERNAVTGDVYYSGYEDVGEVSITFLETEVFTITRFINRWMDKHYDQSARVFRDQFTAGTLDALVVFERRGAKIDLQESDLGISGFQDITNLATRATQMFLLSGMRPLGMENLSLDYTNDGPLSVDTSFAVDSVSKVGIEEMWDAISGTVQSGVDWIEGMGGVISQNSQGNGFRVQF